MRLEYLLEPDWPVQAWLAECRADRVLVRHGGRVETRTEWFCEAVWDGQFADGDFDLTDVVAGSGARLRGRTVRFVTAGNTVDRLQSIDLPGDGGRPARTLVSNSLACLLAVSGARVNPRYRLYRRDMQSIVKGLDKFKSVLATSLGPCRLWYFDNLDWDGTALRQVQKPGHGDDFSSFEGYYEFLRRAMGHVARNAADPARDRPLGLIGTMSSGYDSTTVSTLARDHGLERVICFDEARTHESDSGTEAARHLGLRPIVVRRDAWRRHRLPEVPFLAAEGGGEDRFFLEAQAHLRGKVLLTGYHGDKVWSKSPYGPDSLAPHPQLKRGDRSGLTLTEFRLSAGFVHCPVPFWGARRIHEIVAISRQPAMKPWDVPGDYSRPICRRIVEGAGVPRGAFGRTKLAASVIEYVLSDSSRPDYAAWCARHGIEGEWFDRIVRRAIRTLPRAASGRVRFMFYGHRMPTCRDFYFPWALERLGDLYRAPAARAAAEAGARPGHSGDTPRKAQRTGAAPALAEV
jgi:hypothetical protein